MDCVDADGYDTAAATQTQPSSIASSAVSDAANMIDYYISQDEELGGTQNLDHMSSPSNATYYFQQYTQNKYSSDVNQFEGGVVAAALGWAKYDCKNTTW